MKNIRAIAIHLPQFHPIPENDQWWGKGFTEWTKVTEAKPLFKGHYQPHLPADLGFYDLRLEEARIAQAELAKSFGIHGFCYYHYWFNGKRLLNRPLDDMLKTETPDFPYMLCWANENWSRRWNGSDSDILIAQEYSTEDDYKHIEFLCTTFFKDQRYIRVNNKPVFVIYRPQLFPDIKKTIQIWRSQAKKFGFPDLYICYMQAFHLKVDPLSLGFDAAIEFQPDFSNLPVEKQIKENIIAKLFYKLGLKKRKYGNCFIVRYRDFKEKMIGKSAPDYKLYRSLIPMWDNYARKPKNATILHDSSPEIYGAWLEQLLLDFVPYSEEENFIFINAWNEWGEGNHLEPCQRWGKSYLEITKKILDKNLRIH